MCQIPECVTVSTSYVSEITQISSLPGCNRKFLTCTSASQLREYRGVACVFQATMLFVELSYTLATEEAERIGVDHIARVTVNEQGQAHFTFS